MRALRPLAVVALLAPLLVLAPGRAAVRHDATLEDGKAAFWSGSGSASYTISVRESAWRLRVSFDHPELRNGVFGTLHDPSGKTRAHLSGWMSGEAYVPSPQPGVWTLRLNAPAAYAYRMRARLEEQPAKPRKPRMLLPNLRLVPPYEFTFSSYVSGGRGLYAVGGDNPATSCTADDHVEGRGVRCLRFSVGPANVGEGPLRLDFPPMEGLALPGQATQLITWTDGRVTRRPAGQFEYHKTHAHYHHTGFGSLELLKVTDPARGTMVAAGGGPKQGFCTADVKIAEWRRWGGDLHSAGSTCEATASGAVYDPRKGTTMGLSAGWVDIYLWEQDGNFVDFGLNTDGRYVVRSTADALGHVLETDERDNTAYAYIEVTGEKIRVLERGRGTSPWDPRKVLADDGLPRLAGR